MISKLYKLRVQIPMHTAKGKGVVSLVRREARMLDPVVTVLEMQAYLQHMHDRVCVERMTWGNITVGELEEDDGAKLIITGANQERAAACTGRLNNQLRKHHA